MSRTQVCKWARCTNTRERGWDYCQEHLAQEERDKETAYALSPAARLMEVNGLETMKEWIMENLLDDNGNMR